MSKRWAICPRTFVVACAVGLAGAAQAQINFTVPADAPDGGLGTVGILRVFPLATPPTIDNQDIARALLGDPTAFRVTATAPQVNHVADGGGTGHFGGDLDNLTGDNKAYLFRGNIAIPAAGQYTFNIASDDGFTLAFNKGTIPFSNLYNQNTGNPGSIQTYNGNANGALTYFGGRGTEDTGATATFPSAGTYHFDLTWHDGCCGDAVELSSAQGSKGGFDSSFTLVGGQAATKNKQFKTVGPWDTYTFSNVSNMAATIAVYNDNVPFPAFVRSHTTEPTIAFNDPQNPNNGSHGGDARTFPGDTAVDNDNFGAAARATFTVTAADAGKYTIMVYTDDGFRFRMLNGATALTPTAGPNSTVDGTNGLVPSNSPDGCCTDYFGQYDMAAGTYTMEVINNEIGGGAGLFVYGAKGAFTSFDPDIFQLLGANIPATINTPAGLQLVAAPEPGTFAVLGIGAIAVLARRRRA